MRMLSPLSNDWSLRTYSPMMVAEVFQDFDRVVDSFLKPTYANTVNFQPNCDVSESDDHYLVSFDMPGIKKEDIKIEVQKNQLLISGERLRTQGSEAGLYNERRYGKFERTFTLPATINPEKIEAQYEDGVLNIALPKAEAAKPKTIQIQTGQNSFFSKLLGAKKESPKELKDSH